MTSHIAGASLLFAAAAFAQSTGAVPAFEVASVRASQGGGGGHMGMLDPIKTAPGSLTMRSVSFRIGVAWAYGVREFQVTGPDWIDQARYDIVAKAPGPASAVELRGMLRTLLAERFKLVSHRQTKEMGAWVITVGKNGPKFKESQEEGEASIEPNLSRLEVVVKRTPVSKLADLLEKILRAPVIDQTGLNGNYDITVAIDRYMPDKTAPIDIISTILTGIQQELGLKLDNRKMPLDLVVIDSAERTPVEN